MYRCGKVGRDLCIQVMGRITGTEVSRNLNARIVDEHAEVGILGRQPICEFPAACGVRDVTLARNQFRILGAGSVQTLWIASTDDDPITALSNRFRQRKTDASGTTGDEPRPPPHFRLGLRTTLPVVEPVSSRRCASAASARGSACTAGVASCPLATHPTRRSSAATPAWARY